MKKQILPSIVIISLLFFALQMFAQPDSNTHADLNPEMIFVQGGSYQMGSNNGAVNEKPVHTVTLSDFSIGKTEVTQQQWMDVVGTNPSKFTGCDNCPVEWVTWNQVQEFIKKLNQKTGKNYRLPTEAEWEYAANGGNKSKGYAFCGGNSLDEVAWYDGNSGAKTHLVGQKQPNELGLFDMIGNVWEWCSDWYGNYPNTGQNNPQGASPVSGRIIRGASWNNSAVYCRAPIRNGIIPDDRNDNLGFRLALTP